MVSTSWNQSEIAPANSVPTNGYITGVSRKHTGFDYFWIGTDGSVQSASWYEGMADWTRSEIAPAGSASTTGGIAAVSRISTAIEVWWIGTNGSVQDAYWYEGAGWNRFELAPANSASTVAGIAAVSRGENYMEVWWIGANGSTHNAFWVGGQGWKGPDEKAPAGQVSPSAGISLISRGEAYMEVWYVGMTGSVNQSWWLPGQGWHPSEVAWGESPLQVASISRYGSIIPVSKELDNIEVFWPDPSGNVWYVDWHAGVVDDPWKDRIIISSSDTIGAAPLGVIGALARPGQQTAMFYIGIDGSLMNGLGSGSERVEVVAQPGSASTAGSISVTSRQPGNIELLWIGANGSMQHSYTNNP